MVCSVENRVYLRHQNRMTLKSVQMKMKFRTESKCSRKQRNCYDSKTDLSGLTEVKMVEYSWFTVDNSER